MSIATFTIDGREYVVIPKEEYQPSSRDRLSRRVGAKPKTAGRSPEQWLSANWGRVLRKAKANTKRLTGKTHL